MTAGRRRTAVEALAELRAEVVRLGVLLALADDPASARLNALTGTAAAAIFDIELEAARIAALRARGADA